MHGRPSPLTATTTPTSSCTYSVDSKHEKNEGSSETLKYPPPHHDSVRGAAGSTKTKLRASGIDEPGTTITGNEWDKHDEEAPRGR